MSPLNRREFIKNVAVGAGAAAATPYLQNVAAAQASRAADVVIDVDNKKQLFIDKRFVHSEQGVELVMNPAVKKETVILPDRPWESGWIVGYGTVLEDRGKYKMWYPVLPPIGGIDQNENSALLCYADSDDGVRWDKPGLGIYEWEGSKVNNILLRAGIETSTVFIDPKADTAQRYKLLSNLNGPDGKGIYIYTSSDGLNWTLNPTLLFPFWPDSQNQAFWDTRLGRYVIYVRQWAPMRKIGRIETDDILKPWPFDSSKSRSGSTGASVPEYQIPTAFGYDSEDPIPSDHYTSAAVEYPWAADTYLMFPSAYLHYPNPPIGRFRNDGPVDIQMAVSRDGIVYHRVQRKPYIELGLDGAPDAGSLYMLVGIIRYGDEISQYYAAFPFTHGAYHGFEGNERGIGSIIRASQRLDGFVSLDAPISGGSFSTQPLRFSGRRLVLNMNGSAMGELLVELQDKHRAAIPGYTFEDSDPLHTNHLRQSVSWHGKSDLRSVQQPVRLAVKMRSMKLYAFQFKA